MSMYEVFSPVRSLLKLHPVCIDNNIFRLHYKVTVLILLAFSLLVTCKQFVGDPIVCIVEDVPENVMNAYCWIHATFTNPNKQPALVGKDVVQPGVGSYTDGDIDKYHKYYQWVCFVLFFQAILFYLPRYLWKTWEGGRLKMLVQDLNSPVLDDEKKRKQKKLLVDFFVANLRHQNLYAVRFFFCEFLNLFNVIGQIYLMDAFLEGEFSTYGLDVVKFTEMEPELRIDPMSLVFPKVTKCTFKKYGPSGSVQTRDGLCVLSLNIVNEKIYVFLWFWFMLLSVITGLAMLYRLIVMNVRRLRIYLLRSRARVDNFREIDLIMKQCETGDWFVMYQLSRNVDPIVFRELVVDIAKNLSGKAPV